MAKLLSAIYMFFCLGLALILDAIFDFLRKQYLQNFRLVPMIVSGIFLDLIFVATLLLLVWLILFRLEKSLPLSMLLILTGFIAAILLRTLLPVSEPLLKSMPNSLIDSLISVLSLISAGRSYFSLTATFILVLGTINVFRKS